MSSWPAAALVACGRGIFDRITGKTGWDESGRLKTLLWNRKDLEGQKGGVGGVDGVDGQTDCVLFL